MGLLRSLNSHIVGYVGLATGGLTVLGALYALFALLGDPNYDLSLYVALYDGHKHAVTPADQLAIATLVAACISVFGGFVIALVTSYYGKPSTIPSTPKDQP